MIVPGEGFCSLQVMSRGLDEIDTYIIAPKVFFKEQMKCLFFIAEFERAAKIREIAVYRLLVSLLVPKL